MPVIKIIETNGPAQGPEQCSHHAAAIMAVTLAKASAAVTAVTDRPKGEKPEKTRPLNPNRLTKKQHVFPFKTMGNFAKCGRVSVRIKASNKVLSLKADHALFCARRAWDERAEKGYMKATEDEFQATVWPIIDGKLGTISMKQKPIIDRMFALWYMRARFRELDAQEIQLNGIAGDDLTKEQEEILEKKGGMFVRKGGRAPARQMNGLQLQMRIDAYVEQLASSVTKWGVISTQSGEFIVPDVPEHTIIPLAPRLALIASTPDGMIVERNLAEINRAQSDLSQNYFFAHDFSKCPS